MPAMGPTPTGAAVTVQAVGLRDGLAWAAGLQTPLRVVIWRCSHRHLVPEEAVMCAERWLGSGDGLGT